MLGVRRDTYEPGRRVVSMKRILCVVACLAALLSLAACRPEMKESPLSG